MRNRFTLSIANMGGDFEWFEATQNLQVLLQTVPETRPGINILWDTDTVSTAADFFAANHVMEVKSFKAKGITDLDLRCRLSDTFIL